MPDDEDEWVHRVSKLVRDLDLYSWRPKVHLYEDLDNFDRGLFILKTPLTEIGVFFEVLQKLQRHRALFGREYSGKEHCASVGIPLRQTVSPQKRYRC